MGSVRLPQVRNLLESGSQRTDDGDRSDAADLRKAAVVRHGTCRKRSRPTADCKQIEKYADAALHPIEPGIA